MFHLRRTCDVVGTDRKTLLRRLQDILLPDGEDVKDFVVITFGECFKYTKEKLYSKLDEEKNLRKVEESFLYFLATHDEVKKYVELIEKMSEAKLMKKSSSSDDCLHHYNINILNLFYPELQLIQLNPPVVKNKLKRLLGE